MFGAYVQAALTIGVAVLSAAVLQFAIPFLLPYQGPQDSMLFNAFSAISEYALLIMLAAIAAGVLARSVVESGVR
jgi:hypothetical protein